VNILKLFKFLLITLLASMVISLAALSAREIPDLTGPVVDQANLLSEQARGAISSALFTLNQENGIQFQVLIVPTLEEESIEGFSIKVVDKWKIGKKGEDKSALFLISVKEHKMRIEVGRGLEGELTDLKTRHIIDEVKPLFKNQDYNNGVALGLSLMAKTAGVELKFQGGNVRPRHQRKASSSLILFILVGLIMFFQFFFPGNRGGRGGGYYGGGGGFGGGGFGGGSGGGGGWSGGGGGFSGGGSSGDW
jgi:uncharacterized protein